MCAVSNVKFRDKDTLNNIKTPTGLKNCLWLYNAL